MKSPPLEAYLTSIAATPSPNQEVTPPKEPNSASSVGRVIVLTILSQAQQPLPSAVLRDHSELSPAQYKQTMHELVTEGLVQQTGDAYVLTDIGAKVADNERSRLLMPR